MYLNTERGFKLIFEALCEKLSLMILNIYVGVAFWSANLCASLSVRIGTAPRLGGVVIDLPFSFGQPAV